MKVFLAGMSSFPKGWQKCEPKYLLESFAYIGKHKNGPAEFASYEHLLDSGAFTFLQQPNVQINWKEYVTKYAEFIKKWQIKQFFELDIYKIIGIPATESLRSTLEDLTGRQCIPVWHKHLGKEYLEKLCEEYDYIAFGGFAIKDIQPSEFKFIPKLLEICEAKDTKVHGLGFTRQSLLKTCKFHSIDSTTWLDSRYGGVYSYSNGKVTREVRTKTHRLKPGNDAVLQSFNSWVKFQKYADLYL